METVVGDTNGGTETTTADTNDGAETATEDTNEGVETVTEDNNNDEGGTETSESSNTNKKMVCMFTCMENCKNVK